MRENRPSFRNCKLGDFPAPLCNPLPPPPARARQQPLQRAMRVSGAARRGLRTSFLSEFRPERCDSLPEQPPFGACENWTKLNTFQNLRGGKLPPINAGGCESGSRPAGADADHRLHTRGLCGVVRTFRGSRDDVSVRRSAGRVLDGAPKSEAHANASRAGTKGDARQKRRTFTMVANPQPPRGQFSGKHSPDA